MPRGKLTGLGLVIAVGALLAPASAWGANIAVNTESDVLSPTDGKCSLREATIAANADAASGAVAGECASGSGSDTVAVPAGHYTLGIAPAGEDDATTGDLNLTTDITLQGAGAATTIIDAAHLDRVMTTGVGGADAAITIDGVTITGGRTPVDAPGLDSGSGGGVLNRADLTLSDSIITDNATGPAADAICENCSAGNGGDGGGILNVGWRGPAPQHVQHGSLTVRDSTISANFTGDGGDSEGATGNAGWGGAGGGLFSVAPLTVVNTTIAGNRTGHTGTAANAIPDSKGGGVLSAADTTLTNVTVTGNEAGVDGAGGGVVQGNFTLSLTNTIVAGNDAPNCGGEISDGGGNLAFPASDTSCGAGFASGDPLLSTLGDHGGPTPTRVPAPGSAALDAGVAAACPDTDQRGAGRPFGTGCDIGAVERATPTATTGGTSGVGQSSATLGGSVANPGPSATAHFEYGTTTAYGAQTPVLSIPADVPSHAASAVVGSLAPATTYHYRLVATGPDGASLGADRTFTTAAVSGPPPPPPPPAAPKCAGRSATIVAVAGQTTTGTAGDDVIVGTTGADRIDGRGGNDVICSLGGGDHVSGGSGKDRLVGGGGNDVLRGGPGADRLSGGRGDDRLSGGSGKDVISGGAGNDVLNGAGGKDRLFGGAGNDKLNAGGGVRDLVNCGAGKHDRAAIDEADAVGHCERVRLAIS